MMRFEIVSMGNPTGGFIWVDPHAVSAVRQYGDNSYCCIYFCGSDAFVVGSAEEVLEHIQNARQFSPQN